MKVLTTAGLTKLIELSKGTFLDKNNIIDVSDALATVAITGSYSDLSNKPTINSIALSGNKTSSDLGLQAELVSGTNIKTVNNNSLLGSGNIAIDSLPAQSGQSGKYLTTDGTAASWATVDALPSQTGNNGKYLTTNGTSASWDALAAVANSGSYTDLSNKPTINDLTTTAQQAALNSGATSTNITQITTNKNNISTINGKIPSAASSSNQLADKAFVNSSINAIAAYYITSDVAGDAFATKTALDAGPYYHDGSTRTPTENDYAIVAADETHNNACTRYSYTGSQWSFQYVVNDTPFTQAQLNAINSGINSTMVGYLSNVTSDIQTQLNGKQASITGGASTITSSNLTASKALISNGSGKVAVSDTTSTELGYVHGVTSAIQTQIDSKLDKLTYEWNNTLSFGSTGKLCIGKFCCYDSNITIDIDATTNTTYHGTLVIALQNIGTSSGGRLAATVYGDATNTIAPNIYIYKHGANDCLIEVYFSPLAWSKNIIHTRAVALNNSHGSVSYDSVAFDLCTSVSEIPAEATIKPTNALDSKQATLVSGTNIKTVNNNSLLGSGNLTVDGLPSQSGQSGKYLTTNGTTASWSTVDALPSQTSQSGKFLTTNGTAASWANIPTELPSQSGQNGKYLKTDGSSASWATMDALPSQSGQSGKYLTTNGTAASWATLNIPTTTNSITSGSTAALTSGGAYTNVVTAVAAGTTANKINVTKAGSTSTITINNVANATTASKLGSTTVGGVTQPIYLDSGTPTALSYTIEKSVPSDAVFTDHTYTNGAGINLTNGTTFSAKCDTTTISTNGSSQLQALGVIDKKTSAAVYTWTGTKAQYDALGTYHNDWIYYLTDEGLPTGSDYYTKTQVDTMLYNTNHSITKDTPYIKLIDTNTNANTTTAPSEAHNGGLIQFVDSTRTHTSGYIYSRYETNGDVKQILQVNKNVNNSDVSTYLAAGVKADGTKFTYAPTPAASTSTLDTNIATVGWINDPNKATNVVHITGAETILGAKTFLGNNVFSGTDTFTGSTQFTGTPKFIGDSQKDAFDLKNSDDNYLLPPTETVSTNITITDANGEYTGGWEHYHQVDGTCINQMKVRRQGADEYATLAIGIDTAGNSYCTVPTDTYGTNFHGISTRSQWADLAEKYESDKEYSAGTLIKFGGSKDITAADTEVNGVISDKPGYLLDSDLKDGLPVALAGKTPLRIIGKVKKFDKIVLSEIPGVGRVLKEGENLPVIARALASSNNTDEKLVMCVTKFNLG